MRDSQGLPPEQLAVLKKEFGNLAFLWGETANDATGDNMTEWKKTMLYGPKVRKQFICCVCMCVRMYTYACMYTYDGVEEDYVVWPLGTNIIIYTYILG